MLKLKIGDRIKNHNGSTGLVTGIAVIQNSIIDDQTIWYQILWDGGDLVPSGTFVTIEREDILNKI